MSEETSADLREAVRSRYAEAARAVLEPRPGVTAQCVEMSAAGSCCGSSAADSCCGTGSAALDSADAFGGQLYGEGETDGLPEEAVLASLGCVPGQYLDGLAAAGFAEASVTFTTEAAPGMHSAIIRAAKPAA